ncbi:type I pullulanase [Bacillus horti]|uniref:pullulanase n=1 Tax=Caldalkalibacillus horti TaxID=77523 RepID=A0ABT9VU30_9BACI|nr:type I pullulanase [Bacillus horti]MDQ0164498.1 pullulanase [Bacillus horti]
MRNKMKKWTALGLFFVMIFSLLPFYPTNITLAVLEDGVIQVDGFKDSAWETVEQLAYSEEDGWESFSISDLRLSNDSQYLYYWVGAKHVPNWGEEGQYVNIALQINDENSTVSSNPWNYQYNYSGMENKPQLHIMHRLQNDNEVNGAAVYHASDLTNPLLSTWTELKGAEFAVDRLHGFEGKIPLAELGLSNGDEIKAHVVLGGNNEHEHGAFDVLPRADNQIASSWNESGDRQNIQSTYSSAYTIEGMENKLRMTSMTPAHESMDISTSLEEVVIEFNDTITLVNSEKSPSVVEGVYGFSDSIGEPIDYTDVTKSVQVDENRLILELEQPLKYAQSYSIVLPEGTISGKIEGDWTEDVIFTFTTEWDPSLLTTYKVNYFRYDGQQSQWDMWTWADGQDGKAVKFADTTEDGFAVAEFKLPAPSIQVITRPGNWSEQEPPRRITAAEGEKEVEVWLIQDVNQVFYTKEEADTSPRVRAAHMDSLRYINAVTTHEVTEDELVQFKLVDIATNAEIPINAQKTGDKAIRISIESTEQLDVRKRYELKSEYFTGVHVTMRTVLDDPSFYYSEDDLGLTYTASQSAFKIWAPTAEEVSLHLYDDAGEFNEQGQVTDHTGGESVAMERNEQGVWSTTVHGDLSDRYYMYNVAFADGTDEYAVDPYARAVAANGARTAIVDLKQTNPEQWELDRKPTLVQATDAVIYELHVRDFSVDVASEIEHKGKYKAFTESGLQDDQGNSLGIDHLKELGVTHVHLLPVYDFKTVNELTVNDPNSTENKFNWGYDPQNYNVPEGSYSTDPTDPTNRIIEFKEMVQALHENGIGVIMDVVYNHTFNVEDGPFNNIVPGYYYRTNDAGIITNGSGVGNEIASERPMVRKYIKESVRYWAEEYNIDGFRFDLMGLIDTTTMKELTQELHEQVDPNLIIYGEPWTGGSSPLTEQTLKGSQKGLNFAVFNDHLRGAIKGDSDGAGKGFATGESGHESGIVTGLRGAITDFTDGPTETINYVTAHDNLNLWDKVITTQGLRDDVGFLNILDGELLDGGNVDEAVAAADPYKYVDEADLFANETIRRSLLANGIVLTSQGIPFIHAGDELLRSKYGDHNSYKSPDSVNQIRWENKARFTLVYEYYQGLIELRQKHPAFRMSTKEQIEQNLEVYQQEGQIVAFTLKDFANQDTWQNIVVIYNGNNTASTASLPAISSDWNVVVNDHRAGVETIETITGNEVSVPALSMMVLYDQASEYTSTPATIDLELGTVALEVGQQRAAKATVRDQRGNPLTDQEMTWHSSDSSVATISNHGRITALSNGQTRIRVTSGELVAEANLLVERLVPTEIEIKGDPVLYEGQTNQLRAEVKDQHGQLIQNPQVTWSSGNSQIAEVNAFGRVTGVSAGIVDIHASAGDIEDIWQVEVKPYVKRYIQLQYERANQDYDGWNLWVWGTGVQEDRIDFEEVRNGKAVANIEIAPGVTRIGFIVRLNDWEQKDTDEDRFIQVDPNDDFVKVLVQSGQSQYNQVPSVQGPVLDDGSITFYYRDPELFRHDQMGTIDEVMLQVNEESFEMSYDEGAERFYYTWHEVEEGTYPYTFIVTRAGQTEEVTDPYNTRNGVSEVTYGKPELEVSASILPTEIHHDQNAVLTVNVDGEGSSSISKVYADLTMLGGEAQVELDKELLSQSIAVQNSVGAGQKEIPITVVDEFGNSHRTKTQLNVVPKVYESEMDFDWDEARIYFMLTDRFYNGDPTNDNPNGENYDTTHLETYHGGDLRGIIEKLDYLEALGINTIWITPIVDNIDFNVGEGQPWEYQYAYHGYWAKDFTKIDEHLGDLDTLKELIDQAHDRGIKLMVDVVLNHAGYGMKVTDENVNEVTNFPTAEDQERFRDIIRTEPGSGDITGELAGLPDFETENPAVREQIIQWQVDWLERARTDRGDTIDYFRVDTVKHVESTTWKAFKNALTTVQPEFKLIGESFGDDVANQNGYLRSGQMDSLLDFTFKHKAQAFVNGDIDAVEEYLQYRNEQMDNTATLGQFLSSHDEDGFLSEYVDGDEGKLKVAAALQITAKGQPVIYYGEELGHSGRNANFDQDILGENRRPMPWDKVEEKADLLEHYSKLLNIRGDYSEIFSRGSRKQVAGGSEEGYSLFQRAYEGNSIYVGLNTDTEAKDVTFHTDLAKGTEVVDVFHNKTYEVNGAGELTVMLPDRDQGGTVILVPNAESEPGPKPNPEPNPDPVDENLEQETGGQNPTDSRQPNEQYIANPKVDQEGNIRVKVNDGVDKVILPAKAEAFDNNHTLIVEGAGITLEIPSGVLLQLQQLVTEDELNEAEIVLEISEVESTTLHSLLQSASGLEGAQLQKAGAAFDIHLAIFTKDGSIHAAQELGEAIVLKLQADKDQQETRNITGIYQLNDSGELKYVFGQGIDVDSPSDKVLMGDVKHLSMYIVASYTKDFADIPVEHQAAAAIQELAARQIIKGVTLDTFAPEHKLTRAEFTTLIVRVLGLSSSNPSALNFTDVSEHSWYTESVAAAYEAGLIQGRTNERFDPNSALSYEEINAILERVYLSIGSSGADQLKLPLDQKDSKREITRAEVAQILFQLIGTDL